MKIWTNLVIDRHTVHKRGMGYALCIYERNSKLKICCAFQLLEASPPDPPGLCPWTPQLCPQSLHLGRRHWTWITRCVPLMTDYAEVINQSISNWFSNTMMQSISGFSLQQSSPKLWLHIATKVTQTSDSKALTRSAYTQKKIVLCGSMWNRQSSIRNRTVPNSIKRFNMS